jgi:hypothetical protein
VRLNARIAKLEKSSVRANIAAEFATKLKKKVQKPEFPWEDFTVCESDIDEVLREMGGSV